MEEMDDRKIQQIRQETVRQLHDMNCISLSASLKNTAKRMLGRNVSPRDRMFWPAGMLLLGLTEKSAGSDCNVKNGNTADTSAVSGSGDNTDRKAAEDYYAVWKKKQGGAIRCVDDALAGTAILRLYETTGKEEYLVTCREIYRFLKNARKDSKGSIIYNASGKDDYILADGAGMSAMFLAAYGAYEPEAYDLAALQLTNFKRYGCDLSGTLLGTGLPYHGYSFAEAGNAEKENGQPLKLGIIGWGRAIGWLMMGLSSCVEFLPAEHPERKEILSFLEDLSRNTMRFQKKNGAFAWTVPCMEGRTDTSATGMIGYGLLALQKEYARSQKKLDRETDSDKDMYVQKEAGFTDAASVEASLHSVCQSLFAETAQNGQVMNALGPCEDLGVYRQLYQCYAWGQGAALVFLKKYIVQ